MVLGLSISTFTLLHVILSFVGIGAGLVVLFGLLNGKTLNVWTLIFLIFTAATTVSGFLFPFGGITPAFATGLVSSAVLAIAIAARYLFHIKGAWRGIYVVSAVIALYLNVFVLVVQSFLTVPPLHALAPSGTEPPFAIVQGLVLILFIYAGYLSIRRFRPAL